MDREKRDLSRDRLGDLFLEKTLNASIDIFSEVGANNAEASIYLSEKLPECEVIAFEANPYIYEAKKENLARYPINYRNLAISDTTGPLTFYINTQNGRYASNNSLYPKTGVDLNTYEKVSVPGDTLDNTIFRKEATYSLWIDAEGKGFEVLRGAEQVLCNTKIILIEVESGQHWLNQSLDKDIINFLLKRGFHQCDRDYEWPRQYNILFEKQQ